MNRKSPLEQFEALFGRQPFNGRFAESMEVDVEEADDSVIVTADIPGFQREDIEIEVTDHSLLTISANRTIQEEDDKIVFSERKETMSRQLPLPATVTVKEAKATYNNGVLTITLPKEEEVKETTQIAVE